MNLEHGLLNLCVLIGLPHRIWLYVASIVFNFVIFVAGDCEQSTWMNCEGEFLSLKTLRIARQCHIQSQPYLESQVCDDESDDDMDEL